MGVRVTGPMKEAHPNEICLSVLQWKKLGATFEEKSFSVLGNL